MTELINAISFFIFILYITMDFLCHCSFCLLHIGLAIIVCCVLVIVVLLSLVFMCSSLAWDGCSPPSLNPIHIQNTRFMKVKQSSTILFLSTIFYDSLVIRSCFEPFPSINENATLDLSVIIPAYNEELRLPKMLDECLPYLVDRSKRNPY